MFRGYFVQNVIAEGNTNFYALSNVMKEHKKSFNLSEGTAGDLFFVAAPGLSKGSHAVMTGDRRLQKANSQRSPRCFPQTHFKID